MNPIKTYNKKFNAKRAADSLAKRHPEFTAGDPVDMSGGEWAPNVVAPAAAPVPEAVAEAAYINGAPYSAPAPAPTRTGSKRELVASLLLREDGATAREILAATGWKALNIPGTARDMGITLRQVKQGRTTTYYGTRE